MTPATVTRIAADGTTLSTFVEHVSRIAPSLRPDGLRQLSPGETRISQDLI